MKSMGRGLWIAVAVLGVIAVAGLILVMESSRSGRSVSELVRLATGGGGAGTDGRNPDSGSPSDTFDFFSRRSIGDAPPDGEKPLVAHVRICDLDADGREDVLVCDVLAARVTWVRQTAPGTFEERAVSDSIGAPVHVEPHDMDEDGDLDLVVSAMGIMLPNNDPIGSVLVLENTGGERFRTHILAENIARVTDARPADLDGDGDLDLAVGQFGYDQGEVRWMENLGGWRFESHILLKLAGTIHVPVADMDGDGDLDIVALVSQEWEEIHIFENDGSGTFTGHRIFGAATDDYSSSGIAIGDLDGDGDSDVLYTNGDAFVAADYRPLPIHGVQWLENQGGLQFAFHRMTNYFGAYGPCTADLDGDGDQDGVCGSTFNYWDRPTARSAMWFENDGTGRFVAHGLARRPTHVVTMDTGDLNGDGRPDLVTGGMALYPPFDEIERVTLWINEGR